jgi:hypothetical protein
MDALGKEEDGICTALSDVPNRLTGCGYGPLSALAASPFKANFQSEKWDRALQDHEESIEAPEARDGTHRKWRFYRNRYTQMKYRTTAERLFLT